MRENGWSTGPDRRSWEHPEENMAFGQPRIEYKSNQQMRKMHEAGLVLSRALDAAVAAAKAGVTTKDLDDVFAAATRVALERRVDDGAWSQRPGIAADARHVVRRAVAADHAHRVIGSDVGIPRDAPRVLHEQGVLAGLNAQDERLGGGGPCETGHGQDEAGSACANRHRAGSRSVGR